VRFCYRHTAFNTPIYNGSIVSTIIPKVKNGFVRPPLCYLKVYKNNAYGSDKFLEDYYTAPLKDSNVTGARAVPASDFRASAVLLLVILAVKKNGTELPTSGLNSILSSVKIVQIHTNRNGVYKHKQHGNFRNIPPSSGKKVD
jgi:hypothetical protein